MDDEDSKVVRIRANLDYEGGAEALEGLAEAVEFKVVIDNGEVTDILDTDFISAR